MKKYFFFLSIILSAVFALAVYADVSPSGFIPGQIWYSSKLPLTEGETVDIHTAIWNQEKNSLSAKVEFYDKNIILGTRDVVVLPSELKDISVPWKVTSGDHTISAKILSSMLSVAEKKEKVVLERISTAEDKQSVAVTFSADKILLQNQINKTVSEINNVVPENVSTAIANGILTVDSLRGNTLTRIIGEKDNTQKKIDDMTSVEKAKTIEQTVTESSNLGEVIKKPLEYVKLFLLTVLVFIFGNKVVFYGFILVIIFCLIRYIYRKIRYR
jgi:hypothetical protein